MLGRLLKSLLIALALAITSAPLCFASNSLNVAQSTQQKPLRTRATRSASLSRSQAQLINEVRHELVTLPFYDVFDWLEGEVRADGTVVLRGQVVRPATRTDAESRVKRIEGVSGVVNEIEILPLSPDDDRLRIALYRAIYNFDSPLFRYATRAVPPIHIIVNRGRATLKGAVATQMESQLAETAARGVPGLFEVTNQLRVENQAAR